MKWPNESCSCHIIWQNVSNCQLLLDPDKVVIVLGFDYDPLPPADSYADYSRPEAHRPRGQDGLLTAFFRSLMPNYDMVSCLKKLYKKVKEMLKILILKNVKNLFL